MYEYWWCTGSVLLAGGTCASVLAKVYHGCQRLDVAVCVCVSCGAVAWAILPTLGWRYLTAFAAVPVFITLVLIGFVPRSPMYTQSRPSSAFCSPSLTPHVAGTCVLWASTQRLRRSFARRRRPTARYARSRSPPCCCHANLLTPFLLSQDMPPFTLKPIQGHVDASVSKLFVPALRKSTLLIWLVWFAFGAGYYGVRLPGHCVVLPWCLPVDGAVCRVAQIVLFTPELFAHEATTDQYGINYASILISSASECACCRNGSVLCPARVAHTSNVDADVGVTVAILCIDRFGRVSTQVWMYTLCGVLTPLLAVMLHIDAPVVLFVSIAVTARALVMGASSVTWVYPAEVRAWNWMAVAVVAGVAC